MTGVASSANTLPSGMAEKMTPMTARALGFRQPASEQTVDRRERDAFADAHADARRQQRRKAGGRGERRDQREERPRQHADAEHDLAAEAVGQPSAQHLRREIADEEGREHRPCCLGIPPELRGHRNDRDRHVDAIHVADEHGGERQQHQRVASRPVLRQPQCSGLLMHRRAPSLPSDPDAWYATSIPG